MLQFVRTQPALNRKNAVYLLKVRRNLLLNGQQLENVRTFLKLVPPKRTRQRGLLGLKKRNALNLPPHQIVPLHRLTLRPQKIPLLPVLQLKFHLYLKSDGDPASDEPKDRATAPLTTKADAPKTAKTPKANAATRRERDAATPETERAAKAARGGQTRPACPATPEPEDPFATERTPQEKTIRRTFAPHEQKSDGNPNAPSTSRRLTKSPTKHLHTAYPSNFAPNHVGSSLQTAHAKQKSDGTCLRHMPSDFSHLGTVSLHTRRGPFHGRN